MQVAVAYESINASIDAGGSALDGAFAAFLAGQIRAGKLTTPDQDSGQFRDDKIEGKKVSINKRDGSIWSRERAGDRAHGGSAWKRWDNKRGFRNDHKDKGANRMTIRANGTIRDRGKRKTRGGTRKKR